MRCCFWPKPEATSWIYIFQSLPMKLNDITFRSFLTNCTSTFPFIIDTKALGATLYILHFNRQKYLNIHLCSIPKITIKPEIFEWVTFVH